MPKRGEQDTAGRRWVAAPVGTLSGQMTSAVLGAWLNLGESVEWHWCFTPDGNYVSGYTILYAGKGSPKKICPLGGFVSPVHVKVDSKTSGWNGEMGVIEHGIGENGSFSIRLDSGMRTAFGGNELQASDRNPPVR